MAADDAGVTPDSAGMVRDWAEAAPDSAGVRLDSVGGTPDLAGGAPAGAGGAVDCAGAMPDSAGWRADSAGGVPAQAGGAPGPGDSFRAAFTSIWRSRNCRAEKAEARASILFETKLLACFSPRDKWLRSVSLDCLIEFPQIFQILHALAQRDQFFVWKG